MKTIQVCNFCGSPRVFRDAIFNINRGTYDTYDDESCEHCYVEGHNLTVAVEVPDDFDIDDGMFDLEKLK